MSFTHVFISRPRQESEELAALLGPLGLETVVQPAFDYVLVDFRASQPELAGEMERAGPDSLVVFTSPRAVAHGLDQLPEALRFRSRVAAIGPATARALGAAGIRVNVTPGAGFTSEDLLELLARDKPSAPGPRPYAFIIAAPGGREMLLDTLGEWGWQARLVMVYRPEPAALDRAELEKLAQANGVLSVWTSGNAVKSLSQRLQPSAWYRLCAGDWLVISERLRRLARAYGPTRIHLAPGPSNRELADAIRGLR